jgi:hypothetical protein
VNNVMYVRYAETGRVGWIQNFARYIDPEHKKEWEELYTPKGIGMILRSINVEYKFVHHPPLSPPLSPLYFETELGK